MSATRKIADLHFTNCKDNGDGSFTTEFCGHNSKGKTVRFYITQKWRYYSGTQDETAREYAKHRAQVMRDIKSLDESLLAARSQGQGTP